MRIKLYKIFTGWNVLILLISLLSGFICSNISNVKFSQNKNDSDIKQLINVLTEWKELDTYGK